jgi:large subunit ribosomal protein L15e
MLTIEITMEANTMGLYQKIRNTWNEKTPEFSEMHRKRLVQWRSEPVTIRVDHPTRLDRARSLGYKAKQGYLVVRQRVNRGGHTRPDIKGGRRTKHARQSKILAKNYQQIAEEKVNRAYKNCEVLNSYYAGEDGQCFWYEVILVDRAHPNIMNDPQLKNLGRGRVYRGLTSAGRRSRGLRNKGLGAEKMRPSHRAKGRKAN